MKKIFLVGMPGSGKTTLGRILSEKLAIPFFDLDKEIENGEGESIAKIFADQSESYFREIERMYLHKLGNETQGVISTGGGTPAFFDNMDWINSIGISIYLKQDINEIQERIVKNKHLRPLFSDLNEEEITLKLYEILENRRSYYEKAQYVIEKNLVYKQGYIDDFQSFITIEALEKLVVNF
jgi:shikimate kinase